MDLSRLRAPRGANRDRKRVGRGRGSGKGKTCGRGMKGAGARSGSGKKPGFEGGQMPLARRLPKYGFTNPNRVVNQIVKVGQLARFPAGSALDLASLVEAGLVGLDKGPVKLLADGELAHALTVCVHKASAAAVRKVEATGGKVELVSTAKPGKTDKGSSGPADDAAKGSRAGAAE